MRQSASPRSSAARLPRTDGTGALKSQPRPEPRTEHTAGREARSAHRDNRTPIESKKNAKQYRAWDDAPLQLKVSLLITVAAVGGVIVGILEAIFGFRIWLMTFGLAVIVAPLLGLAWHWVTHPVEHMLWSLERVAKEEKPGRIPGLPLSRRDEIGRLARIVHQMYMNAARDYHEARRLRRTLDDRVEKATHQATRELRNMAFRDPLTDCANRRFVEEQMPYLVDSAIASHTDLICLAIDMDNFKQVNDSLGHAAGDELLIFFASLAQASVREQDYVVRLGGDEFAILLPGASVERGAQVAEQLLALFRQHVKTAFPADIHADLSIGLASLQRCGARNSTELLDKADSNLYDAKNMGKGRIVGAA